MGQDYVSKKSPGKKWHEKMLMCCSSTRLPSWSDRWIAGYCLTSLLVVLSDEISNMIFVGQSVDFIAD
jgi:hypothetical protein